MVRALSTMEEEREPNGFREAVGCFKGEAFSASKPNKDMRVKGTNIRD